MMPQRKKVDKETGETWNPYKGSTDVSAWQILDVVVASEAKMQNIHQVPKVVSFFGEIEEHISSTMAETVTIDVFAANYGAQDAIIDSVLITNTTLPIRLFDKSQPELLVTSIEAVRVAKEGVWWYTRFLGGVSSLHSRKKEMPRADLRSSTIFELEQKFNLWILNLKTENLDEKIREWDDIVISHLLKKMDADVKTYGVPMMRIRARDETGRNIFNLHNMYAATLRKKLKRSE